MHPLATAAGHSTVVRVEPGAGRFQDVLLELAALDKSDTEEALRRIVRLDAETLGIQRVNWWRLTETPPAIRCDVAYELATNTYSSGVVLCEAEFPRYFRALREEQLIAAEDAHTDPRTSEFTESYLLPLGIGAMLDIPVWLGGRLAGVLCHEWVGPPRPWTSAMKEFATSMGQLVATTLEVREKTRAEEGIRARDEFLSVASHELYTPLASLQLAVDALRSKKLSEADSERSLALLDRQVKRLTHLVSDLLDVSRLKVGRLIVSRERFDLIELVREVVERFSTAIEVHADGPVVGSWDRSRIDQVITNLVSNATKFSRGNPVEVSVESLPSSVRLRVRDRGIGITSDQLPRIFERFERAVSARSYGGLGLGLFIVRGIVEAHGGTVSAESTVGEGTVITVDLPSEAAGASTRPPA